MPFWLIAWGEKYIDSGMAGIAQATVPIFSLLIGLRFLPHERIGAARVAGVCLGLVGVAFVAGGTPEGGAWAVAGTLAVVLASVSYAGGRDLRPAARERHALGAGARDRVHARGERRSCSRSRSLSPPTSVPTAGAIVSLLLLALFGTALAQLVLFRVVRLYGARRLSLVTYLLPGFALVYGAVILDERVGVAALAGLALILARRRARLRARCGSRRRQPARPSPAGSRAAQIRMRTAVAGGQPRPTSSVASCRSTLRSSASTKRGVAVEAGRDQLLDPPAEDLGDRVRAGLLGDVGGWVSSGAHAASLFSHEPRGSAPRRTGPSRRPMPPHGPARARAAQSGTSRSTS